MTEFPCSSGFVQTKPLGKGTFCLVVEAVKQGSSETVAIKYPKQKKAGRLLVKEAEVMRRLLQCQSKLYTGVPKLIEYSTDPPFIVMEKVGKTLLDLQTEGKKFSLKTILLVAVKGLSALEEIHSRGFLHRDVKPDNIATAANLSDPRIIFIDLGLSCRYILSGSHIPYSEKNKFQGTPFFCSLNVLRGIRSTRRDDLEALGYVLVFLCTGSLPWFTCNPTSNTFFRNVLAVREKHPPSVLCQGLEPEFQEFLTYCQNLGFSEKPNYENLRMKFVRLTHRLSFDLDWKYDWTLRKSVSIDKSCSGTTRSNCSASISKTRPSTESSKSDRARPSLIPLTVETVFDSDGGKDELATPVHRIDQLPAFRWQRTAEPADTEVVEPAKFVLPTRRRC